PLGRFGYMAGIGVTCAFALSMTLVPCLLSMLPPPNPAYLEKRIDGRTRQLLDGLGRPTRRRSRWIVGVSALIVVASGVALTQLEIGSNPTQYFKQGDPIRVAMENVDAALGGTTTVEFLVEAPND